MNYIRKAVELADGWSYMDDSIIGPHPLMDYYLPEGPYQPILDALAAQLVRQVDATKHRQVVTYINTTDVIVKHGGGRIVASGHGKDRTLNTIKAIVDSGVLDD